jgi:uncharacterized protein YukE
VATVPTVNPLVVAGVDKPADTWAGVWIAEDIELIAQGVRDGSWIDGTLGVTGASLDALALISDPVGALLQYGVAWIIEHVRPLSEALDWLAGDPGQISANAATWRNVAADLRRNADELVRTVRLDAAEWTGAAGDAYRAWMARRDRTLQALAAGADTISAITEGAGLLVAAVRILVRDAIATVVSRLIGYAAEEVASLGMATPLLIEQVTTLVASWAAKIARWLQSLIRSLERLAGQCQELERLIEALRRLLHRSDTPRRSDVPSDPPKKIGSPSEFDPRELRGLSTEEVRARVPGDWRHNPSARGGGEVYADPAHGGRTIRIMPGYPPGSRPDPLTWGPYVVVSQQGRAVKIPLEGNPTLS